MTLNSQGTKIKIYVIVKDYLNRFMVVDLGLCVSDKLKMFYMLLRLKNTDNKIELFKML